MYALGSCPIHLGSIREYRSAGDLRRHPAHYEVSVMSLFMCEVASRSKFPTDGWLPINQYRKQLVICTTGWIQSLVDFIAVNASNTVYANKYNYGYVVSLSEESLLTLIHVFLFIISLYDFPIYVVYIHIICIELWMHRSHIICVLMTVNTMQYKLPW